MRKKPAFTTIEALIAAVIMAMIFGGISGAYMLLKGVVVTKTSESNLQQDVTKIAAKIIRGYEEQGGIVGLRSAVSFTLPVVVPAGSSIQYVGTDGQTRNYSLSGNTIQYTSPTQSPVQQVVYTAPAGASITLRFWEPAGSGGHETIGVYLGVSQLSGNRTISGSISTYINIRNLPK